MANNIREQIKQAGERVAENMAHAADWVKEKTGMGPGREEGSDAGIGGIRPHMEVFDVNDKKVGAVDRLEGDAIKLTKDSCGDGMHHFLPVSMVARVDGHVHLNRSLEDVMAGWKPNSSSCGSCG
jgi:hypothetical protein